MQERIAVVFDFDDTLGPDSTSGFLAHAGITDIEGFWKEVGGMMAEGWDPVPAYLHHMIHASRSGRIKPMTCDALMAWGKTLPLFEGVEQVFSQLRDVVADANPRVSLEFYLISSGIGDVLRQMSIADEFTDIWASEFHYDEQGHAVTPKRIISFTDKTRYLFQIQKGVIGPASRAKPFAVNMKVPSDQLRIPLNQMIFVGDGYTDIPCFSLIKKEGGIPIAVYDQRHVEKWGNAFQFVADGRVSNLHSANYQAGSDLTNFLSMAVRSLAQHIAVSASTYQG
ncbi:haloacid dehalogenase-like hydrolase [Mariprofundus ferrooxydans]|uniref:haloacid dehalogenase-like hydrolase n=1 Tax=Mariprofundus ferrooxydans TaxID=314344 RepID=UPI0014318495|nr:haloacid dehalogenase-like hydrolase [Mariprofundus ferrooxydans]